MEKEQITIELPKNIMDILRFAQTTIEQTPKEWIEYKVIDAVRAALETAEFLPSGKTLAEKFGLTPIFKEIAGVTIE